MKVKICGLTRAEDVRLAVELGAWAAGLVFAPSPRRLSVEKAKNLRGEIPRGVLAVGVFQDASREEILEAVRECSLDAVQLHGSESPEDCRGFPVPVFKAFSLKGEGRPALKDYEVAGVLLEPERRAGTRPSLQAQRALWKAAAGLKGARMLILAGGLDPGNVAEAVRTARPGAVDVSSGVESGPGIKDPAKLRAFFEAVRGL